MARGVTIDDRRVMAMWMRSEGRAPEAFIRHYEETGELDGRLWPVRMPVTYHEER